MRIARLSTWLLQIVAVAGLAACDSATDPTGLQPSAASKGLGSTASVREVTFMTYNIYQGTELENSVAATSPDAFVAGATTDFAMMRQTNFAERAGAIAAEIDANQPDLIGLQEVALWRTGPDTRPATPALTVDQDFLQLLLAALGARGLRYNVVASVNNFDVQGPAFVSGVFEDVRLTDRNVILARREREDPGLQISNAQSANYANNLTIPTVGGPVTVLEGWASVDVKKRGRPVRFVTTHLDAFVPAIRYAQATELLARATDTDLPVVVAGDLNTTTSTSTYSLLTGAQFVDLWASLHPSDPGFTCCEALPAIDNATAELFERVDMMMFKGEIEPEGISIVGANPSTRTASGLWPSDHAGLVGRFVLKEHQ